VASVMTWPTPVANLWHRLWSGEGRPSLVAFDLVESRGRTREHGRRVRTCPGDRAGRGTRRSKIVRAVVVRGRGPGGRRPHARRLYEAEDTEVGGRMLGGRTRRRTRRSEAICSELALPEVVRGGPRSCDSDRGRARSTKVNRGRARRTKVVRGRPRSSEVVQGEPRSCEVDQGRVTRTEVERGRPR